MSTNIPLPHWACTNTGKNVADSSFIQFLAEKTPLLLTFARTEARTDEMVEKSNCSELLLICLDLRHHSFAGHIRLISRGKPTTLKAPRQMGASNVSAKGLEHRRHCSGGRHKPSDHWYLALDWPVSEYPARLLPSPTLQGRSIHAMIYVMIFFIGAGGLVYVRRRRRRMVREKAAALQAQ
jgi:hypothetical protein